MPPTLVLRALVGVFRINEREVHCVDNTPKLDNSTVARALNDAPVVYGDCGIDQVAPKGAKPSENSILVRARKPGVADNVCHQDRGQFPGLAHGTSAEGRSPVARDLSMVRFHAALGAGVEAESASLCVDRPVYPRRRKHNTVAEGGIADGPSLPVTTRSMTRVRPPPAG